MLRIRRRAKIVLAAVFSTLLVLQGAGSVWTTTSVEVVQAAEPQELQTKVKAIEKYGNIVLEIQPEAVLSAGYEAGDMVYLEVNGKKLEMPFCTNFSDVDTGDLILLDYTKNGVRNILAAINMGHFANTHGAKVGDDVKISLKEKGAYREEYEIRHLERTNNIADYGNDPVVYANFRQNDTTGIKPGILYRSSSPINNEIKRAKYANDLAEQAGIKTVMNLADTPEEINTYAGQADFASPYYKKLFDEGSVKPLSMSVDVGGEAFGAKLAEGLRFLIDHNGPYLVHCTEGKDRAGFVSAVLSGLMGASLDEIVEDYMVTYENYYHVEKGSSKYKKIAEANIVASMTTVVAGLPKGTDISNRDLSVDVENYLKKIGLKDEEIKRLKICLSSESGTVKEIEKYGHASTDIKIADMLKAGYEYGDMVKVTFDNGYEIVAPFVDGYYVDKGKFLVRAYPGHETIAVCINYGKLYETANVVVGDRLKIEMEKKGGYLDEYLIRNLKRTNDRKDYASDEVFANFRSIAYGNTAENRLYRSSSPINNELGRAAYADRLIKEAGINTVVNLADAKEQIPGYLAANDQSPYYKSLYEGEKVKFLNLGLAYQSPEFQAGIIEGLKFMAENKGPYLFHCTEGKDRTGFLGALLNSLMGATQEEIVADYMKSYENFYGVTREANARKYDLIAQDVVGMLKYIAGTEDLTGVDLSQKARTYMLAGGMTETEIDQLVENLSKKQPAVETGKLPTKPAKNGKGAPKTGDETNPVFPAIAALAAACVAAQWKKKAAR